MIRANLPVDEAVAIEAVGVEPLLKPVEVAEVATIAEAGVVVEETEEAEAADVVVQMPVQKIELKESLKRLSISILLGKLNRCLRNQQPAMLVSS